MSSLEKSLFKSFKAIKLLEENIKEKFYDIGLGNDFLATIPKVQATEAKIKKWEWIKLICLFIYNSLFITTNKTITRILKKANYGMDIFGHQAANESYSSKYIKKHLLLNSKKHIIWFNHTAT